MRTKSEQWRRHQITFHLEGLLEEPWLSLRYLRGFVFFFLIFIYLFGCTGSCLWHVGSLLQYVGSFF